MGLGSNLGSVKKCFFHGPATTFSQLFPDYYVIHERSKGPGLVPKDNKHLGNDQFCPGRFGTGQFGTSNKYWHLKCVLKLRFNHTRIIQKNEN